MATTEAVDASVKAPEAQRPAMILIGGFGLAAVMFCVAAEISRVRTYHLIERESSHIECIYPRSPSMWYAVAGTVSLLLTQAAGFVCGSFAWIPNKDNSGIYSTTRTSVGVVLVTQLIFAAAAAATLLTAGLKNASLPTNPALDSPNHEKCQILSEGVFLTAAVLSLFSGILVEAYYIMSIKAKRETWMEAYSAGPVDGLEMLSTDTSVLRVPGSAERGGGDDDFLEDDEFAPSIGQRDGKFSRIPRP